ncbi:hypothetical protein K439DRAFT_52578 [Ramaria rubella]|nr:hypothetical protein K439DRAFT_52578 [Ramaria rubella]
MFSSHLASSPCPCPYPMHLLIPIMSGCSLPTHTHPVHILSIPSYHSRPIHSNSLQFNSPQPSPQHIPLNSLQAPARFYTLPSFANRLFVILAARVVLVPENIVQLLLFPLCRTSVRACSYCTLCRTSVRACSYCTLCRTSVRACSYCSWHGLPKLRYYHAHWPFLRLPQCSRLGPPSSLHRRLPLTMVKPQSNANSRSVYLFTLLSRIRLRGENVTIISSI